jgi:hypothetical protein
MDTNQDGKVSVEEFISIFIEAEGLLKEKIKTAKKNIRNFQEEKQKIE